MEVSMSGKTKPTRAPLIFSTIEDLRRKGHNQSEIAEMFGVTRQAVSWQKKTYGGRMTPRDIVREAWPFETTNAHTKSQPYQRLRDHGEYQQTGGKGMSDNKLMRLRAWYRKLRDEDVVLEFDPSIPPGPGLAGGGFRYVPRDIVIDGTDLLIRVNEHTAPLDEKRELIWSFPDDLEEFLGQS
ncbi:immunity repressor [Mycobacterium phage Conquerage]|uniref:Immunity repressor n=3 Tax=Fromanvirus alma TaxID=1089111 RepID=A0A142K4Y3_9CAUD|nr:immunity repressor [Mycobacterium phage Eidsmoe]AVI03784.1 immunity repressor [Mycobacterium phage Conquerage]